MMKEFDFNENYRWGPMLGSGAFGKVYSATQFSTDIEVAVKTERVDAEKKFLSKEYRAYCDIHGRSSKVLGIPKPFFFGRHGELDIMIMSIFGPTLRDRMRQCTGSLSNKAVCMVALQTLRILEEVHGRGYIHCDLKPDNFLTSPGKGSLIYLTDFGMAERFHSKERGHVRLRSRAGFAGTIQYTSARSHLGFQPSRRDDLESLGYCLIYLHNGSLPWEILDSSDFSTLSQKVCKMKENMLYKDRTISVGMSYMRSYFDIVGDLDFEETPDYNRLRRVFRKTLLSMNRSEDGEFDWITSERVLSRRTRKIVRAE